MKICLPGGEFVRSGGIIFLATLFASLISFFINILISNLLGPSAFGNFKAMIYLFTFLPIIADFGINSCLTKYVSEFGRDSPKVNYLIKQLLKVKAASYLIIGLALLLLNNYIAVFFLQDASLVYIVNSSILLFFMNFSLTFGYIVLGLQNFKMFATVQFLTTSLSVVLALALSPLGMAFMIVGWGLGLVIGSVPAMRFIFKRKGKGSEKFDVRSLFKNFSLPVYPIDLTTNIFNIIVPVLSLFFAQRAVGYYSFAFMFYFAATMIPNSLSFVLLPKISELHGKQLFKDAKSILMKAMMYYTPIALAGIAATILLSDWFIGLISSSYLPSLLIFKVVVSLGFAFGYNIILANYLKARCKIKEYAISMLTQNLLLITISFVLLGIFS